MGCERASKVWLLSPFRFRAYLLLNLGKFGRDWDLLLLLMVGREESFWDSLLSFVGTCGGHGTINWVFNKKWIGEQDILGHELSEFNEFRSAIAKESKQLRQPTEVERIG